MADNVEPTPSSPDEINPKIASDIHYWSGTFGVSGDTLHEAIRVHGGSVEKVKAALEGTHSAAQHEKRGR
jgi:hypothetical protein